MLLPLLCHLPPRGPRLPNARTADNNHSRRAPPHPLVKQGSTACSVCVPTTRLGEQHSVTCCREILYGFRSDCSGHRKGRPTETPCCTHATRPVRESVMTRRKLVGTTSEVLVSKEVTVWAVRSRVPDWHQARWNRVNTLHESCGCCRMRPGLSDVHHRRRPAGRVVVQRHTQRPARLCVCTTRRRPGSRADRRFRECDNSEKN